MDNGNFILPGYVILVIWIVQLDKKLLAYFYRLAKTTLDTKFCVFNSKDKDLQYNGTFILPDYIILIFQIVKLGKKWLAYFYRLAKTTLDTKFHVSNSKNKDLQYNGTFILPNLPATAPKCSDVSSDLNVPFKLPAQKKRLLKVSLKTVENWKNAGKCALLTLTLEPVCLALKVSF